MSSLLEQAIVDAKALKEAALKNAENLVIEKYSQEIKKTMDGLLNLITKETKLTVVIMIPCILAQHTYRQMIVNMLCL